MSQQGGLSDENDYAERMIVNLELPARLEEQLAKGGLAVGLPSRMTMKVQGALRGLEDVPWNSGHEAFCVSERLAQWLEQVCPDQVRLHPIHRVVDRKGKAVECPPYRVVEWTAIVDCLDEELTRWNSTPAVPGVRWPSSPVIRLGRVPESILVFRPRYDETGLYARRGFMEAFLKTGFSGMQFCEELVRWVP